VTNSIRAILQLLVHCGTKERKCCYPCFAHVLNSNSKYYLSQEWTSSWRKMHWATEFCSVAAIICVLCVCLCGTCFISPFWPLDIFEMVSIFCNMCGPMMKSFLPITFRTQNIRNCHRHFFVLQSAGARSHVTQPYTRNHRQGLPRLCRGEWHVSVYAI